MTTTRSALSITAQNFRKLGLAVPKKMTDELDRLTAALSDRAAFTVDHAALGDAVADAMINGRDPLTDPAVDVELKRRQLAALRVDDQLGDVIERRRADLVSEYLPAIIGALAGAVADADSALHEAREAIPGIDLADPAFGSLVPASLLPLWGNARRAVDHASTAAQTWTILAMALRFAGNVNAHRPLILADLTAAERDALGRAAHADAAIHAGHRLALATPEEFAERVRRVEERRVSLAAERIAAEEHAAGKIHRFTA